MKLSFITLMLAGLFAFIPAQDTQAQTNSVQDFNFVPAGPYVTTDVAMTRVMNYVETIKPQLDFLAPHTQEYRNLAAKVDFYLDIHQHLTAGNPVQASIQHGLNVLVSDAHETLPKSMRQEYKEEAIQLLKL